MARVTVAPSALVWFPGFVTTGARFVRVTDHVNVALPAAFTSSAVTATLKLATAPNVTVPLIAEKLKSLV